MLNIRPDDLGRMFPGEMTAAIDGYADLEDNRYTRDMYRSAWATAYYLNSLAGKKKRAIQPADLLGPDFKEKLRGDKKKDKRPQELIDRESAKAEITKIKALFNKR